MNDTYVNLHQFSGFVSNEPEAFTFPSGSHKTAFNVAVKPPYASEEPMFMPCEAWNKLAQTVANFVHKGDAIGILAEMSTQRWTDRDTGEIREKPVFTIKRLNLLAKKEKSQRDSDTKQ